MNSVITLLYFKQNEAGVKNVKLYFYLSRVNNAFTLLHFSENDDGTTNINLYFCLMGVNNAITLLYFTIKMIGLLKIWLLSTFQSACYQNVFLVLSLCGCACVGAKSLFGNNGTGMPNTNTLISCIDGLLITKWLYLYQPSASLKAAWNKAIAIK